MESNNKSPYEQGLDQSPANYIPLSPLTFIERSASVWPEQESIVYGTRRYTWSETFKRCRRLASALSNLGIGKNNTVAVILANTPEMVECCFAVPATGAVLNTINIRLDANTIGFILNHGEADCIITDTEFAEPVSTALTQLDRTVPVINVDDTQYHPDGQFIGDLEYEKLLQGGDPEFHWNQVDDEWNAITLNYTSGTTGNPKGVVYHHRGAYLNALSNIVSWSMAKNPRFLWTVPMFHCNGWCFPWTLAAIGGTNICLRKVTAKTIFIAIADEKITHFGGAPIVLNLLINANKDEQRSFEHPVEVMTAAAPPPAATLEAMQHAGFNVTHVYGLTETYGPATLCSWRDEWNQLPMAEQSAKKSRQGVRYHSLEKLAVLDPETMAPVPADGETMGEVMFRGNIVMKGYLKNPEATDAAFAGGWFHSGDLGVMDPDGYIKLKDRSKDIIISGGENISSIEVENVLHSHPCVLVAAVVAKEDAKWGETPCAFVELKPDMKITEQEIILYCREHLAHFKCPHQVIFQELPKTSTGKIQKFKLRDSINQR